MYVRRGGHTPPPGHGGAFSERVPEKPLPLSVKERVQLAIDKYRQVGRLAAVGVPVPGTPTEAMSAARNGSTSVMLTCTVLVTLCVFRTTRLVLS